MIWKSPETVVRNALVSDASFTSIAGHRVYPNLAPADTPLPFAIWRRTGVRREQTLGAPVGVPKVVVELQMFSETYFTGRELADAARQILDGFTGTFDNTVVSLCRLDSESDGVAAIDGSEVPNAYMISQEYEILWQEI